MSISYGWYLCAYFCELGAAWIKLSEIIDLKQKISTVFPLGGAAASIEYLTLWMWFLLEGRFY